MKTVITQNLFLAELPLHIREALSPSLEMIEVNKSPFANCTKLREDSLYFPLNCLCTIDLRMRDGFHAHLGLLGFRDAVGLHRYTNPAFLGSNRVLTNGYALQLPMAVFEKQCDRSPELQRAIQGAMSRLMHTLGHATACNLHHPLQRRLSRWLLCAAEAATQRHFEFTHEELASIMGVRREAITESLARLSLASAVETSRGRIAVKDESLLREFACECHELEAARAYPSTQAGWRRRSAISTAL